MGAAPENPHTDLVIKYAFGPTGTTPDVVQPARNAATANAAQRNLVFIVYNGAWVSFARAGVSEPLNAALLLARWLERETFGKAFALLRPRWSSVLRPRIQAG